jgi:hypothetical protein
VELALDPVLLVDEVLDLLGGLFGSGGMFRGFSFTQQGAGVVTASVALA